MALYGTSRDISLFNKINRELINNVISQEVGYYKISLNNTVSNLYEESINKTYNDPVLIPCLIERTQQTWVETDIGIDLNQSITFRFLRDYLLEINIVPEIGDIVLWSNNFYEINSLIENDLILGKNPNYSYSEDNDDYGSSLSIILQGKYIRPEKVGIRKDR
jgi:hypothetical protein